MSITTGELIKASDIPLKSAQTYIPGINNQSIAAGQYLTGAQTIVGSSNLIASNIKNGVDIFGVIGTSGSFITLSTENSNELLASSNVFRIYKSALPVIPDNFIIFSNGTGTSAITSDVYQTNFLIKINGNYYMQACRAASTSRLGYYSSSSTITIESDAYDEFWVITGPGSFRATLAPYYFIGWS